MDYIGPLYEIRSTDRFKSWFDRVRDRRAKALIRERIDRLAVGHLGDVRSVGGGVLELRIHGGPGYRVYYAVRGTMMVMLLAGGDKSTQPFDIVIAQQLAREL